MKKRQAGFSLIELLGGIAVGSILMVGLLAMMNDVFDDTKGQQAALYQAQIVEGANKYILANYGQLAQQARPNSPVKIELADLVNSTYLPKETAPMNVYGQTPCVLIVRSPVQPVAGTPYPYLNALIVTHGGQRIEDKEIASVAAGAGIGNGYISAAKPEEAQGATWDLKDLSAYKDGTCLGTANDGGHLASALFFDGQGQQSNDFLYRDAVPNRPDLNTMNTPIILASIQVENASCTPEARGFAVSTDASGVVLSCQPDAASQTGRAWHKQSGHWKDPVENFSGQIDSLDVTQHNEPGDVRMVKSLGRAFTWNGTKWVALAVDQNGALATTYVAFDPMNVQIGDPCSSYPDGSTPVQIGTAISNAAGIILTCQADSDGNWTWQQQFKYKRDETLSDHHSWIILPSAQSDPSLIIDQVPLPVSQYPLYSDSSISWGYWSRAIINSAVIKPNRDVLVFVRTQVSMSRQAPVHDPLAPVDPDQLRNNTGQFQMMTYIRDLDNSDPGVSVDAATNISHILRNESVSLNSTINHVLPKNKNGYQIQFFVYWTTFLTMNDFAANIYSQSSWGYAAEQRWMIPLWLTYSYDVM